MQASHTENISNIRLPDVYSVWVARVGSKLLYFRIIEKHCIKGKEELSKEEFAEAQQPKSKVSVIFSKVYSFSRIFFNLPLYLLSFTNNVPACKTCLIKNYVLAINNLGLHWLLIYILSGSHSNRSYGFCTRNRHKQNIGLWLILDFCIAFISLVPNQTSHSLIITSFTNIGWLWDISQNGK